MHTWCEEEGRASVPFTHFIPPSHSVVSALTWPLKGDFTLSSIDHINRVNSADVYTILLYGNSIYREGWFPGKENIVRVDLSNCQVSWCCQIAFNMRRKGEVREKGGEV